MFPTGDQDLLRSLSRGDPRSFDRVVEAYRGRVARLAYRLLGWDAEAEDVVQDVFLAALTAAKGFRGESSPWTWLAAITVNRCRSLRRKRLVRAALFAAFGERKAREAAGRRPDGPEAETLERVTRAVRALPQKLREAAVLRYLEEMSIDEAARVLKISPNAVEVRLHRARERLRRSLAALVEERPS